MRWAAWAAIGIGMLALAGTAEADSAAATRGKKVVDQWCRMCHLRASDKPDATMAPRYEDIVKRPAATRPISPGSSPRTTFP